MKKFQVFLALLVIFAMLLPACKAPTDNGIETTPSVSVAPETEGSSEPSTETPSVPSSESASDPATGESTEPSSEPATGESTEPSSEPGTESSQEPTVTPTVEPTVEPTREPTLEPTVAPTQEPTQEPATKPTERPTEPTEPSVPPTTQPSQNKGSGTKTDPYLITCLEDLLNLRNVVNKSGYYYKQTANIDCSSVGNWIVIGTDEHPFRHHYDGNGYTISNLRFDGDATALFQNVEDSHFQNITIVNAYSSDNHQLRDGYTGKFPGDGGDTAAIVGYGIGCSLENCRASVDFKSSNSTTGGLIGFLVLKAGQKDVAVNCHVTGNITGGGATGGLIGEIWAYWQNSDSFPDADDPKFGVRNCSVNVNFEQYVNSIERAGIGGLVGIANGISVTDSYAKGNINALGGNIGGLVGYARHAVEVICSYAEVDITAALENHYGGVSAGGLIGQMLSYTDVHDCYATGDIYMPYAEWSPCQDTKSSNVHINYYNPCGSLIGSIECMRPYTDYQKIQVYNCYATGIVTAPNICEDERVYCHGALVGMVVDKYSIYYLADSSKKDQGSWDCFTDTSIGHFGSNYNIENLRTYYTPMNKYQASNINGLQNPYYTALPQHQYVEIITAAQLTDQATFVGWDFVNVWKMTAEGPVLR